MINKIVDSYKSFVAKRQRRKKFKEQNLSQKTETSKVRSKKSTNKLFPGMIFRLNQLIKPESKEDQNINRFILFLLAGLFIFLVGFVYPFVRIREVQINVQNKVLLKQDDLTKFFNQYQGKSMLFFHNKNIATDVYQAFPEIQSFDCRRIFPHLVNCEIIEYKSAFLVQKGEDDSVEYIVNQAGIVISKRLKDDQASDQSLLRLKNSNLEFQAEIGDKVIEDWMIEYVFRAKNIYETRLGMAVSGIWWLQREREIHLYMARGFPIYLSFEQNLDNALENLIAVFGQREFPAIEYIDLRVNGKVFIKEFDK